MCINKARLISQNRSLTDMILCPLYSVKKKKEKKAVNRELMNLNATYADMPAPHWDWEEMPDAPVPRLDGFSIQLENLLYVFAGYGSIDHVR